ncbi:MAG: hypothetical protein ACOYL8_03565 [Patescibacteria group bacterium]
MFAGISIPRDKQPDLHEFDAVVSNQTMGEITFNPEKINLFISERQRIGGLVGRTLLSLLPKKIVLLNSAFLDWLLENQQLIPESWKKKFTFFAGTVFELNGNEVIRYLYHGVNGWASSYRWLDRGFHLDSPVAIIEAS